MRVPEGLHVDCAVCYFCYLVESVRHQPASLLLSPTRESNLWLPMCIGSIQLAWVVLVCVLVCAYRCAHVEYKVVYCAVICNTLTVRVCVSNCSCFEANGEGGGGGGKVVVNKYQDQKDVYGCNGRSF